MAASEFLALGFIGSDDRTLKKKKRRRIVPENSLNNVKLTGLLAESKRAKRQKMELAAKATMVKVVRAINFKFTMRWGDCLKVTLN